jgi:hypothetical protein
VKFVKLYLEVSLAKEVLELVHNDLMGPFPHPLIDRAKYFLTLIDYNSRYTWVGGNMV